MKKSVSRFVPLLILCSLIVTLPKINMVRASGTIYIRADGQGFLFASPINIISPSNSTYSTRLLTLNVSVTALGGSNINISMAYSLDGIYNDTIPIVIHYPNSSFVPWLYTGCVTLPELFDGPHKITTYLEYDIYNVGINGVFYQKYVHLDNSTVYFTINDGIPPIVSNLSLQNKTYGQSSFPLNFTTDEPTSWMGYSLDGQANVTITGNTTLTGLSNGLHNLTVYAKDRAGNTGASETIHFTVAQQSESLPTWIVATIVMVAVVGAALLVYFRKIRKTTGEIKEQDLRE